MLSLVRTSPSSHHIYDHPQPFQEHRASQVFLKGKTKVSGVYTILELKFEALQAS